MKVGETGAEYVIDDEPFDPSKYVNDEPFTPDNYSDNEPYTPRTPNHMQSRSSIGSLKQENNT